MDRPDPDGLISARLADIQPRRWVGEVWRHTFGLSSPERTNLRGARWNPPSVEALYVSIDRETVVAEGDHLIASQPLRPSAARVIHRLHVTLEAVVDLTDPEVLASLGVLNEDLRSDDFRKCQAVGAAAAFLQLDGIVVPSARSPGHNIVILFSRAEAGPDIQVLDSEQIDPEASI